MKSCYPKQALLLASALCLTALLPLSGCKPPAEQTTDGASPAATASTGTTPTTDASASPAAEGGVPASAAAFDKPRKAQGDIAVTMVTNNASNFWIALDKGVDAGKAEVSCTAKRVTPPGATPTNNDQKATFEQAVASGVDGIAVTPISAEAFSPVIDAAVAKGIPVITFDSDAPKSKRIAYIGTNNYEAGKQAGEAAVKLLPNGGKFVAFVGNLSAQNARDRYQGFVDATKDHNITMLQEPFQDNGDKTGRAISNVKDAITKYGTQINGFLGIYSYNGPGIVQAVKGAGIRDKVKIICFDGDPETLKNLQTKTVDATVVQKPYEFGRLSTKMLYLVNRKGYAEAIKEMTPELEKLGMKVNGAVIDTGVDVITPDNIGPFMDKLKKLGLETT